MDGRITVLKERIVRNLRQEWTVKDLAESMDISEPHLQKLFKDAVGMPPIKFIQHLRFEKAKELLKDRGFLRIQEICNKVGINDPSHFTRNFKKKYGKTPSQYRQDYWNKYAAKDERGWHSDS